MKERTVLVTGGAGFIGSMIVRVLLRAGHVVRVLDSLTYAGIMENLSEIAEHPNFMGVVETDVCNMEAVKLAMEPCDSVIHAAAESHVDRSIKDPLPAQLTNYMGTATVLTAALEHDGITSFVNVSTDEVYGVPEPGQSFVESDPLNPRNPYSAAKAGADQLGRLFFTQYGLPVITHRAANNYGPRQFPEKLIPLCCHRALHDLPLSIYGDGMQVRDWLHVEDNARAIAFLLEKGEPGEAYNVPGDNERPNVEVIQLLLDELGKPQGLAQHVEDRPGHDIRYSIVGDKVRALGWEPQVEWEEGMRATIRWFAENQDWLDAAFERGKAFHDEWYADRLGGD